MAIAAGGGLLLLAVSGQVPVGRRLRLCVCVHACIFVCRYAYLCVCVRALVFLCACGVRVSM